MQRTSEEFSLTGYRALITRFRDLGYQFRSFTDNTLQQGARHLLLRHDVDICLARAVMLARLESELHIQSLYCVLLTSELYNPLSRENISHVRELIALGHEVGLHFDVSVYNDRERPLAPERMTEHVAMEAARLTEIVRVPVRVMSFHIPAKPLQGLAERIAGLIHTYEPRFFSEIGYVSDSSGEWRYGHPSEHPKVRDGAALQLLTHPVWWARAESSCSPLTTLDEVSCGAAETYRLALAQSFKAFRVHFPERDWERQI